MTNQEYDPYGRAVDWAERWLDKGYIKAWFEWIEWVTLTSVLITVTIKAPNVFFTILASIPAMVSLLMVYFSGIVAASKLKVELINKYKINKMFSGIISFMIGVTIPTILLYVIMMVIFTLTSTV
ncbi:MAG: hypothetical protein KZQ96_23375 [Candidatus Thiodiazotropha sp. (ex Lucinoma borealis)]|nr:hypothetical protein [Candidatus Thiodiazotropha sp. (ex Lucinoma borealis)]